jgi:hypothetical protein
MSAQTRVKLYKLDSKIGVSISDQISPVGKNCFGICAKKKKPKKKKQVYEQFSVIIKISPLPCYISIQPFIMGFYFKHQGVQISPPSNQVNGYLFPKQTFSSTFDSAFLIIIQTD